jgi:hypothetical protein
VICDSPSYVVPRSTPPHIGAEWFNGLTYTRRESGGRPPGTPVSRRDLFTNGAGGDSNTQSSFWLEDHSTRPTLDNRRSRPGELVVQVSRSCSIPLATCGKRSETIPYHKTPSVR